MKAINIKLSSGFYLVANNEGRDDNRLRQGIQVSHSSCIAYVTGVVYEKDERAYMAPDDTNAIAPLKSSFQPSPCLASVPNRIAPLSFGSTKSSASSWLWPPNSLVAPLFVICNWITNISLEDRQLGLNDCELLTQEEFFRLLEQRLVYGGSYFLSYFKYGGLLE